MPRKQAAHVPPKTAAVAKGKTTSGGTSHSMKVRDEAFVAAYLSNGENVAAAARSVGAPEKTARQDGQRWLKRLYVQQLIKDHQAKVAAELESKYAITRENVLSALSNLVFADPRLLFHADGRLKHVTELDERTAKMVSSFEVEELYETEGHGPGRVKVNTGRVTKVRMWDKNSAVDKAMRHLGLFEKDNEQARDTKLVITEKDAGVL